MRTYSWIASLASLPSLSVSTLFRLGLMARASLGGNSSYSISMLAESRGTMMLPLGFRLESLGLPIRGVRETAGSVSDEVREEDIEVVVELLVDSWRFEAGGATVGTGGLAVSTGMVEDIRNERQWVSRLGGGKVGGQMEKGIEQSKLSLMLDFDREFSCVRGRGRRLV